MLGEGPEQYKEFRKEIDEVTKFSLHQTIQQ